MNSLLNQIVNDTLNSDTLFAIANDPAISGEDPTHAVNVLEQRGLVADETKVELVARRVLSNVSN
jgi:hypothetical protein